MGRGPDPSFTAMVFCPCEGVVGRELCRMIVGRQSQGLELVSIIGSENDVWHFGPGPSFTAIVFWLCEGSLAGSCEG